MKAKSQAKNMKKIIKTGLFNNDSLESLKKSGFTGKLRMSWSEGMIDDFRLSSSVSFSKYDKKRHGRFLLDLDDDDDDD